MMYGNLWYAQARCTNCGLYIRNLTVETHVDVHGKTIHNSCNRQIRFKPHPSNQAHNQKKETENIV